jgi:hypothetical protein
MVRHFGQSSLLSSFFIHVRFYQHGKIMTIFSSTGTAIGSSAFLNMRKYPFRAVTVATKEAGRYRTITSVEDAAEFLAHDWPTEKGPTHLKARIACLDVMERTVTLDIAREAFIDSAKESGIYIGEGRDVSLQHFDRRLLGMRDLPFPYVTVMTEHTGKTRNISSVNEAAEFLLHDWPIKSSKKLTAARQACLDALHGKITCTKARDAFIEAAREADIYIGQKILTG